jgi:SRSO17 transposase
MESYRGFFRNRTRSFSGHAEHFLRGIFQSDRVNAMRIEEAVPESDQQSMQHLLSDAVWDHREVLRQVSRDADALLGGHDDSCLLVDESGFAKKCVKSAGVERQWNGRLGKVENSQVGVFAGLVQGSQVALIDARLYLPKSWIDDPERCDQAKIPETERVLRSKSELALTMVREASSNGVRYAWVAADGGYGKEPEFLRGLDDDGARFVIDVHKDQRFYVEDPKPHIPATHPGRGRPPSRLITTSVAVAVETWAAGHAANVWQEITVRHATKGELRVEAISQRVWFWNHHEIHARAWTILAIREIGNPAEIHYVVSNAPAETALAQLVRIQRQRFWIEYAFRDAKGQVGLADYHVRTWNGWHRHMTLCAMALTFLVKERRDHQEELPLLSARDLRDLIAVSLPRRQNTPNDVIDAIIHRHHIRHDDIIRRYRRQAERDGEGNPTK